MAFSQINPNKRVTVFKKIFLNIFRNFTSNKQKASACKKDRQDINNQQLFQKLKYLQGRVYFEVNNSPQNIFYADSN